MLVRQATPQDIDGFVAVLAAVAGEGRWIGTERRSIERRSPTACGPTSPTATCCSCSTTAGASSAPAGRTARALAVPGPQLVAPEEVNAQPPPSTMRTAKKVARVAHGQAAVVEQPRQALVVVQAACSATSLTPPFRLAPSTR
ncbi:MAG TPA: hypothetical protein VGO80_16265 [Solirubrobacteraceae bacterium]|jgi:hypothetical protein|nr:hypothetical protein [Solirubrobacteraceae bacterium]